MIMTSTSYLVPTIIEYISDIKANNFQANAESATKAYLKCHSPVMSVLGEQLLEEQVVRILGMI